MLHQLEQCGLDSLDKQLGGALNRKVFLDELSAAGADLLPQGRILEKFDDRQGELSGEIIGNIPVLRVSQSYPPISRGCCHHRDASCEIFQNLDLHAPWFKYRYHCYITHRNSSRNVRDKPERLHSSVNSTVNTSPEDHC